MEGHSLMIRITPPSLTAAELDEMEIPSTNGDEHEISALDNIFNINIRICTIRDDETYVWLEINLGNVEVYDTLSTVLLCLDYWGGR